MLVDTVLHSTAVTAGFEIAMLLRCARTGSGRHGRTVMEFSREAAACRLTTLLDGLALDAHRDEYVAGGWHRYEVHRVVSTGLSDWPLSRAWSAGYERARVQETRGERWFCSEQEAVAAGFKARG